MPYLFFDFPEFSRAINQNGVTIFVSGFLLTLSLYHFLLYFQHKDKSYIYYSSYTFLIFLYIFFRAEHFFLSDIFEGYHDLLWTSTIPLQWVFYIIYMLFIQTYLELEKNLPQWNKIVKVIELSYLLILVSLLLHFFLTRDSSLLTGAHHYFFIPSFILFCLVSIILFFKIDSILKYYVITGSFFYILFGVIAFLVSNQGVYGGLLFFYFAIFLENIFFALGLGAKQKKILRDRNTAQEAIIKEHHINIQLQQDIKNRLDEEVAKKSKEILELTKRNEKEHRRKLAAEFSKRTLDLRMKALHTQMNPHFLFNSLNSIKHFIIKNKKEDAAYFLSKLSRLLRKILDNTQQKEISLQEELDIMQLYLEVENLRLNKAIKMTQIIAENIDSHQIKLPPLVLQPFIENAIWHGLALKKGEKSIQITITKLKRSIQINIEDNGIGREKAAIKKAAKLVEKEATGIELTRQRLEAYTEHLSQPVSILFKNQNEDAIDKGTCVTLEIPMLFNE